jgi:MFS transporter, FSR family, fosmidomycin resistance protein
MTQPSGSARSLLFFSCIGHAYAHLFVLLYATAVLVIERQFELPFADLMWLSVPGFVMFGAGAVPAGWLADRWSGTGMLSVYFVGLGAASVITGLANSPTGLLIGLTLIGTFASIYHPVGIALVIAGAKNRGRALGINGVFGTLGTGFAAIAAGLLADSYGWRAAFFVPGGLALLTGVAFQVAVSRGAIDSTGEDAVSHEAPSRGDQRRGFALLVVTTLCVGFAFTIASVGLPKFFSERLPDFAGQGATGAGILVGLVYLLSSVGQIVGGEMADRFTLKWVYLTGHLLQIPTVLVAIASENIVLIIAVALVVTMGTAIQPAENALVARLAPQAWRNRVFGLKFVITLGVGSLGAALVPAVHHFFGSMNGLLWALMAIAVVAAIATAGLPSLRPSQVATEPAE